MKSPILKHATGVGLFVVVLYLLCLAWRLTMADPEVIRFHMLSLKTALPGFTGYTAGSVVWGGAIAFVYGFLGSYAYHALHRKCGCCAMK